MRTLLRVSLGRGPSLADALRAVRDDRRPFALVGRWAGGGAIVGSEPLRTVEGEAALGVLDQEPLHGPPGAVGGGWFGYLGFGLGAAIEALPPPPPRPCPLPSASFAYYDHVLRLDRDGEWWFEALPGRDHQPRLGELRARLERPPEPRSHRLEGLRLSAGAAARHRAAVAECVERIAAGELLEANLGLRLEGRLHGSAADAFAVAAQELEPAYGAFLGLPDGAVLSLSPELFLRHRGDTVTTAPRTPTGRAALLRAAFPPGSVTGAPKLQALKAIGALEGTQREVYTGAIGFAGPVAGLELNVAIRTLEVRGSHAWMGCGGAIVADSDPETELREALGEAAPIARALGGTVPRPVVARRSPDRLPPWPRRPDPGRGLLETLAVRDGAPDDVARHLARLRASAEALYGLALPPGLPERLAEQTGGGAHVRLRIRAMPRGDVLAIEIELAPAGAAPAAVSLRPLRLAGGLGEHKWLDRPQVENALVVDLDGSALETERANLWVLRDGALVTPPADGRLLPGTVRARLLEAGIGTEAPVDVRELAGAEAILVTSSIRIAVPAALAGRAPTAAAVELAAALRAARTSAEYAALPLRGAYPSP